MTGVSEIFSMAPTRRPPAIVIAAPTPAISAVVPVTVHVVPVGASGRTAVDQLGLCGALRVRLGQLFPAREWKCTDAGTVGDVHLLVVEDPSEYGAARKELCQRRLDGIETGREEPCLLVAPRGDACRDLPIATFYSPRFTPHSTIVLDDPEFMRLCGDVYKLTCAETGR
ncbi:MAG: hypothetical protein WC732_08670 [Candidatus Omnitrophota bacterium]